MIDIITFLTDNSDKYAEYLKYTAEIFSSGKYKINWLCIGTSGKYSVPNGFTLVETIQTNKQPSENHAEALNIAYKYVQSKYAIYIDADIALLYSKWDEVVIKKLNKVDVFGTEYTQNDHYYRNFPNVYFFCFNKHILNTVKLDFRPRLKQNPAYPKYTIKVNKKMAEYTKIPVGQFLFCDTGWKLPAILKRKGFTSNVLTGIPNTKQQQNKLQLPNPIVGKHPEEWHYNGKLFLSHKGRSRGQPITSGHGKKWKDRVDAYISQQRGDL